ncbi:defensin-like protein 32 [Brassica napus]|uniref:defensin-like protein 32 n=1 Tax=Brassica napus TaxID=3708 RepID=UPI000BBE3E9A|nr:defensin-like protein 32 [Brassica napus]
MYIKSLHLFTFVSKNKRMKMALSRNCIFLVFLCLTVLLIPEFAKAQGKGKPIVIGTCYQFPHCNQTCVESDFSGGKCVPLPPARIDFVCVCYPKY